MIEDEIKKKLKELEEKENVKVLLAVESGSRAWGMDSKDSDYDVRFIYVRPVEDYLRIDQKIKDTIEWQLDKVFDMSGWDLKKALQLMHKSNPSLCEWLQSPIVYVNTKEADALRQLMHEYYSCMHSLYHYIHMADLNMVKIRGKEEVRLKGYLYVIRALLSASYISSHRKQPPLVITDLIDTELPGEYKDDVSALLAIKKKSSEVDMVHSNKRLNEYIETKLEELKQVKIEEDIMSNDELNEFFFECLKMK